MNPPSRVVLIPLAGGPEGRVARVEASARPSALHVAGLNPQIAELQDWNLYEAGAMALGAVRRLDVRPLWLMLARRLRVNAPRLGVTNGPEIRGLAAENASSAELGLALALLMHMGQSRDHMVAAAGMFARDAAPNAPTDSNVHVLPVARLGEKFAALGRSIETQKGASVARGLHLFTPLRTTSGEAVVTAHAEDLARLDETCRAHGVTLAVCPVESLKQAMAELGVERIAATAADRSLVGAAGALAAGTLFGVWLYFWLGAPLKLAFAAPPIAGMEAPADPVRAVYDAKEQAFRYEPNCLGPQGIPVYRKGDSMVFRAAVTERSPVAEAIGGYRFAVVGVFEQSPVKVFSPETFATRAAGPAESPAAPASSHEFGATIPIEGPDEEGKLIVLARKLQPFDAKALRAQLDRAVGERAPAERINAALASLSGYAPGILEYSFKTTAGEAPCATE